MQGFTTSEGLYVAKQLLMDDARSFDEVLVYEGAYHRDLVAAPVVIEQDAHELGAAFLGNTRVRTEISSYCTIDDSQIGGERWRSVSVRLTDEALASLDGWIGAADNTVSFKVIVHDRSAHGQPNRALIIASFNLGPDLYLAYVDPSTIPSVPDFADLAA